MHLLELFSGTGSVGRAFRDAGWRVTSVDMDPKSGADHIADVLEWEPAPGAEFDFVWASPPCTEYSRAKTVGVRNLALADAIAQRTLALIRQLNPRGFAIENPYSGLLKTREFMTCLVDQLQVVNYCRYGFPYKKATAIWTNLPNWVPRPLCTKAHPCPNVVGGRHPMTAQRGPSRVGGELRREDRFTRSELYRLPPELCDEIAGAATRALKPRKL